MWNSFIKYCPDANPIHNLLSQYKNNIIINDHIALRTFDHPKIDIDKIIFPFLQYGYEYKDQYVFKDKKLFAKYYQHKDTVLPKIFISQLETKKLSTPAQNVILTLCEAVNPNEVSQSHFCYSGRPWEISQKDYNLLLKESEYAAWVSAFGFIPNHFTISINHLQSHKTLESVNTLLQENHYTLNTVGGLIKGSSEVFLEQSSTIAKPVLVKFLDGNKKIPGGFYEFAKRYKTDSNTLYHGFVPSSADKIFSSTNSTK